MRTEVDISADTIEANAKLMYRIEEASIAAHDGRVSDTLRWLSDAQAAAREIMALNHEADLTRSRIR